MMFEKIYDHKEEKKEMFKKIDEVKEQRGEVMASFSFSLRNYDNVHLLAEIKEEKSENSEASSYFYEVTLYNGWEYILLNRTQNLGKIIDGQSVTFEFDHEDEFLTFTASGFDSSSVFQVKDNRDDIGLIFDVFDIEGEPKESWGYLFEEDIIGEANFSYHSQKGKDTVLAMTEVEKLRFAIAATAKKAVLHHYQKEQTEGDHVGK